MKDRAIIVGLAVVGLLAAFYFMILSPKREKASQLSEEVAQLQSSIDQQEQVAAFGEQARAEFPRYYGRLVVLGKAVPEGADSASLIVQLNDISNDSHVDLRGLRLSEGGAAAEATGATAPIGGASTTEAPSTGTASTETSTTPSTGTTTTPTDSGAPATGESTAPASGESSTTSPTAAATAPATEAMAASLPIGATVGAAGLPIMPYGISLTGSYFDVADFMAGVDSLVHLNEGQIAADGRLLTLDGFALTPIPTIGGGQPQLSAQFALTSYVTPAEQGLTGGATPGGPASPAQPSTTPTTTPAVSP